MVSLTITHDNGMLGRSGECLTFRAERGAAPEKIPINQIDDVVIFGYGSVSTQALHLLMDCNIPVHYIGGNGAYKGSLTSGRSSAWKVRLAQIEAAADPQRGLEIVKSIVAGKLRNQSATLRRALYRSAGGSELLEENCRSLLELASRVHEARDVGEARGIEGVGAAAYFSAYGLCLRPPWQFNGRTRRPPKDPVNALLSFGYTLLLGRVVTAAAVAGLDPTVGWLHPPYRSRPALALDLIEEFRSVIVDRFAIALLNQGILRQDQFMDSEEDGVIIAPEARRKVIEAFSARLRQETTNKATGASATYISHIAIQARAFIKALRTNTEYQPFAA